MLPVLDGIYLTGSKKEDNYKLLIMKLNKSFELEWEKTFGNETTDFEGQSSIITDGGLLICGCSEGHATDTGGHDWKAYLLKLSKSGKRIWEQSLRIRGNECAYNILVDSNIILFGETKDDAGKCSFFLSCLDSEGSTIWLKQYGDYPKIMAGGIINSDEGYIFSGSAKIDNVWHAMICAVGVDGEVEWEKKMPGDYIFQMRKMDNGFLLAGEKTGNIWLTKLDNSGNQMWESTFDKGTGTSIISINDCIFLGGDIKKEGRSKPILYKLNMQGKQVEKIIIEKTGWIEAMTGFQSNLLLVKHGLEPTEHSELIQIEL
jgi:outer membrane protein assembly factor BamB